MTFTFNAGIPAANNNPSVDQPVMLQNNIATNGIIAVDHVGFNISNGGEHNKVTFVPQTLDPGSQLTAPIVYCKTTTYPGPLTRSDLYMETSSNDGGGTAKIFPLTNLSYPDLANVTLPVNYGVGGYTFLPGGYIMQWGAYSPPPLTNPFTVPFIHKFLTEVQSITVTPQNIGTPPTFEISMSSLTNFQVTMSAATIIQYMAIGY